MHLIENTGCSPYLQVYRPLRSFVVKSCGARTAYYRKCIRNEARLTCNDGSKHTVIHFTYTLYMYINRGYASSNFHSNSVK